MTPRQLARLALLLLAVLALWGLVALTRGTGGEARGGFALPSLDTAAVDSVVLVRPGDTARLVRSGRVWQVNGGPALQALVTDMLETLVDSAPRNELVAQNEASYPRLGVGADSGRRLRVVAQGRTVLDLTSGRRTEDFEGVYVRRTEGGPVYAVRGRLADVLDRTSNDWRDKRIAAVPAESVGTVEITRRGRSYRLRRQDDRWTLGGGGEADSATVAALLDSYRRLTGLEVASPAAADSIRFGRSWRVRVLSRAGGPLLGLQLDSTAAGVWVRHDTGGTIFRIDPYTADRLAPTERALRGTR